MNWDCVENGVAKPEACTGMRTVFICIEKEKLKLGTAKPDSKEDYDGFLFPLLRVAAGRLDGKVDFLKLKKADTEDEEEDEDACCYEFVKGGNE